MVSICIPAYNCEKYIAETIGCFCRQTYSNIEIIVVNDGSSDGTAAAIQTIRDERLRLINVDNGGAASARNIAFSHSGGEFIIFFDADDLIREDFVYHQLKAVINKQEAIVLAAWGRFHDDDIRTFKLDSSPETTMSFEEWIRLYWYNCNPMTNPGRAIIPRDILKRAGAWDERLSLNDDLEFFTRVFLNADRIIFNHEAVLHYRSGISGLSSKKGTAAYLSLYNATLWSTAAVTEYYNSSVIRRCCANLWQCLVYDIYPNEKQLIRSAEQKIREYGGSDFRFPSGGYTRLLSNILGWKATKTLKSIIAVK